MIHFNSYFPVKISIFLSTRTCHFANLLILLSKPKLAHSLNFMFAFRILLTAGLGSTKCLPIWEGHFNPQNGLADMKIYLESLTITEQFFANDTSDMGYGKQTFITHTPYLQKCKQLVKHIIHILSILWCYFPFASHQ